MSEIENLISQTKDFQLDVESIARFLSCDMYSSIVDFVEKNVQTHSQSLLQVLHAYLRISAASSGTAQYKRTRDERTHLWYQRRRGIQPRLYC